jgi:hypothetical protein
MLFFFSVGFVIIMDLLFLQISLRESLDNVLTPFKSMLTQEILIISLMILYAIGKPAVIYFKKKSKRQQPVSSTGPGPSSQSADHQQEARYNHSEK